MAGGPERHDLAVGLLYEFLAPGARLAGCRPFTSNRLVRTRAGNAYYPDVMVICGPTAHRLYEADPAVLIEVFSPSTADQDRREKAVAYAESTSVALLALVDPNPRPAFRTPVQYHMRRGPSPLVPGGALPEPRSSAPWTARQRYSARLDALLLSDSARAAHQTESSELAASAPSRRLTRFHGYSGSDRPRHRFATPTNPELLIDGDGVMHDGLRRDAEYLGDLLVGQAAGEKPHHLALPVSESVLATLGPKLSSEAGVAGWGAPMRAR